MREREIVSVDLRTGHGVDVWKARKLIELSLLRTETVVHIHLAAKAAPVGLRGASSGAGSSSGSMKTGNQDVVLFKPGSGSYTDLVKKLRDNINVTKMGSKSSIKPRLVIC